MHMDKSSALVLPITLHQSQHCLTSVPAEFDFVTSNGTSRDDIPLLIVCLSCLQLDLHCLTLCHAEI